MQKRELHSEDRELLNWLLRLAIFSGIWGLVVILLMHYFKATNPNIYMLAGFFLSTGYNRFSK